MNTQVFALVSAQGIVAKFDSLGKAMYAQWVLESSGIFADVVTIH